MSDVPLKHAPHTGPADCPTYYDGCHCTVDTLEHNIERAERAEMKVGEATRRLRFAVGEMRLAHDNYGRALVDIVRFKALRSALLELVDTIDENYPGKEEETLISSRELRELVSEYPAVEGTDQSVDICADIRERARIVRYLREMADGFDREPYIQITRILADNIERGDHLVELREGETR